jgi:hypothetical protein
MPFFKEIPQILSEFSKTQKLLALILLLCTIAIISVSPSLISAITLDRKDLEANIKNKEIQIDELKTSMVELDSLVRSNQRNCTNEILKREVEFLDMLRELKKDAKKIDKSQNLVLENLEIPKPGQDTMIVIKETRRNNNSPMVFKIENFEKKIRDQMNLDPIFN